MTVYLSLGSNRGDREAHLLSAVADLAAGGVHVISVSPMWETRPVAATGRRLYLNCAVSAETDLPPRLLLRRMRQIERRHGRHGHHRGNPPRTLDMDLIFYGRTCISTRELQVPHPRFARRRFVLAPLAGIASRLRPPRHPRTSTQLLKRLRD